MMATRALGIADQLSKATHHDGVDGLRAVAVAFVLIQHVFGSSLPFGGTGVQLFFVISGFLITKILLRCKDSPSIASSLRTFYIRRFLRIFPLYYFSILLAVALRIGSARQMLPWELTYTLNFKMAAAESWYPGILHFWSLCVEEQFYFIWPALVFLAPRDRLRPLLLSLVAFAWTFRLLGAFVFGISDTALYVLPFGHLDGLAMGALLATGKMPVLLTKATPFATLVVAELFWMQYVHKGLDTSIVFLNIPWSVAACGIVQRTIDRRWGMWGRFLEHPFVRYLGRISYGIYVYHLLLLYALGTYFPFVPKLTAIPLTVGVAMVSWHLFESRINALKNRFPYVPRAATHAAQTREAVVAATT